MATNYKQGLKDVRGEPLLRRDENDAISALILEDVCLIALNAAPCPTMAKAARFKLMVKVAQGADLAAGEIAALLDTIKEVYPPAVVGAVYQLLDPEALA